MSNSSTQQRPWSARTRAPASSVVSEPSRTTETVRPVVVDVFPPTYTERSASSDTRRSIILFPMPGSPTIMM